MINKILIILENYAPLMLAMFIVIMFLTNTLIMLSQIWFYVFLIIVLFAHFGFFIGIRNTNNSFYKKILRSKKATRKFNKFLIEPVLVYILFTIVYGIYCIIGANNFIIIEGLMIFLLSLSLGYYARIIMLFVIILNNKE